MARLGEIRWDLGARRLRKQWSEAFSTRYLREDVTSALSVALLAIPLSLAIALASGVPPGIALVSAVVAGMIAAGFGGTPLAVTGPAAAMAVLVGTVVEERGLGGLLVVTMGAGLLQMLAGVFGFGRFARLVPVPVIEGFTAGIGAIILVGQLPRALGLAPPPESHVVDVITHIGELFHETNLVALGVALGSLGICMLAGRIHPRMPGPLLAVLLPTLVVSLAGLSLERIGHIPGGFPAPALPSGLDHFGSYLSSIVMVFALASLESLLSSAAVDKLARGERHDPDQEFVGQGLANVGSALFGGMPTTSVIARSALNVHAGGKTRRAAFLHALFVLTLVLGASRWLALIPVAALAGVLMSIALRMLHPHSLIALYKASRADAAVFMVTFVLMVALDLIQGVQWGLGAAFVVAAIWSTRHHLQLHGLEAGGLHRLTIDGSLTFLSAIDFDGLRSEAASLKPGESVILDLSGVNHADASGAEHVAEFARYLLDRDVRVLLLGMRDDVKKRVLSYDEEGRLADLCIESEAGVARVLGKGPGNGRLSVGVASYRRVQLPRYEALYRRLASSQSPHTLFITCADSRIVPNLITSTDPGELFIMRNVGNMIPPFSRREMPASAAGVEYAVGVLNVSDLVVCGHSACGAIKALRHPDTVPGHLPSLRAWLSDASVRRLCDHTPASVADDDVARMNTLLQLEHLRTYEIVRQREATGELRLRAWFFNVGTGDLEMFDHTQQRWLNLEGSAREPAAPTDGAHHECEHGLLHDLEAREAS
jgi:carbonic anhydrase